jgi:hypothetical protein
VTLLSIAGIADITIYPFLHLNDSNCICIVVSLVENNEFLKIDTNLSNEELFYQILHLIEIIDSNIAFNISKCRMIDHNYKNYLDITPFFKQPLKLNHNQIILGVGEVISKNDPITAQGLNSGFLLVDKMIKYIFINQKSNVRCNSLENYENFALDHLKKLVHLNIAFTQNVYNFHDVFIEASNIESLKNFIFKAYENIDFYFPWINDINECKKLIEIFKSEI